MPTQKQLVDTYGLSRPAIYRLRQRLNLKTDDLKNPDVVFNRLLEHGRSSRLRTRLSDPATRAAIAADLDLQALRGPAPDMTEKISAIS